MEHSFSTLDIGDTVRRRWGQTQPSVMLLDQCKKAAIAKI
jgi:hypothetical protein